MSEEQAVSGMGKQAILSRRQVSGEEMRASPVTNGPEACARERFTAICFLLAADMSDSRLWARATCGNDHYHGALCAYNHHWYDDVSPAPEPHSPRASAPGIQ